ncbi:UDP-glycosyltransferase, partial [Frankliniella fusca]
RHHLRNKVHCHCGDALRRPSRTWFAKVRHSRKVLTSLVRLRTGHASTPTHLHRFVPSALCPRCGADRADAVHLVDVFPFSDRVGLEAEAAKHDIQPTFEDLLRQPARAVAALGVFLCQNPNVKLV